MNKLTVNKAILGGQLMINIPVIVIFIIGIGLSFYLGSMLEKEWICAVGIIPTFIFMWLWWSFSITIWRIWAFENCRNVHELKRRAINNKLIWPDGSKYEKTEIRTARQKKKLDAIQKKFLVPDEEEIIVDNGRVPEETVIYYSNVESYMMWGAIVVCFCLGFYYVIEGDWYGYLMLIVAGFGFYYERRRPPLKDKVWITLNDRGIKTTDTPFLEWKNVRYTEIRQDGFGRRRVKRYLYMEYYRTEKEKRINKCKTDITESNISNRKLNKLIRIYQQRNKALSTSS